MTDYVVGHFGGTVARDLLELVRGELLGEGAGRQVHRCALRPDIVLKFETGARSFQNAVEWTAWRKVQGLPSLAAWFAPCVAVSACGSVLAQRYAEPFAGPDDPRLPRSVPAAFTDLKVENWGTIDGRAVCVDYGVLLMGVAFTTRTRRAAWWSGAGAAEAAG